MGLNLKAEIDPKSGFCFGVVNAIKKAEEILREGRKLYCLGQIVHNDEEVNRLEKMGLVTVTREDLPGIKGQTVLIRAHGEPPETYEILEKGNNEIIDATCPIVIRLQKRVNASSKKNETILIFGKKDHPEVVGLIGQIKSQKHIVFENFEELDLETLPRNITLYSQTTMSIRKLYSGREMLENAGFDVDFKDTVCRQVSNREGELSKFCLKHDRIVFVAGKASSNGRMLYNHCKTVNPNSYKITSPEDLEADWFSENDFVGICGATSTPRWLMEEVRRRIEEL